MPVYDYVCGSCRHRFEVFRGLNEAGPHQCPVCEGPVTRAFAPPTIHFKGSGWAKKDRRSSGAPSKKAAADVSQSSVSQSSVSQSGDSKSGDSTSGESTSGESNADRGKSRAATSGESSSRDSQPAPSGPGD